MRKLRDIAKDLRDDLAMHLETLTLTDESRKYVERLIADFDQWDAANRKRVEYMKSKAK